MLSFLKEASISDDTIEEILTNFPYDIVIALDNNKKECLKIIELFKKIGITNIEDLLIYESYIFLKSYNRITDKLANCVVSKFVEEVNDDYAYIEKLI